MSNAIKKTWGRAILWGLALATGACGGHANLGEDEDANRAGKGGAAGTTSFAGGGSFALPTAGSQNVAGGGDGDGIVPYFELPSCTPAPDAETWIAFDTDRDNFDREIYLVHPDGTGVTRVTERAGIDQEPAFSPDGNWLSFTSDRDGSAQIYLLERATGAVTQLTHRTEGADQSAFSHDGQMVAFHSGASTYTIGVDGTNERLVLRGIDNYNAYGRPQFTLDDTRLLLDRNNEIDVSTLDGSEVRNIVQNTTAHIQAPSLSPNGVDVAYVASCFYEGVSLWTAPYSLSTVMCTGVRLTPPGELTTEHPSWGPGDRIVYARVDKHDNTGQIAIVARDRGAMPCAVMPSGADDRNPNWSRPAP